MYEINGVPVVQLTRRDLQVELNSRWLNSEGTFAELVTRLEDALQEEVRIIICYDLVNLRGVVDLYFRLF